MSLLTILVLAAAVVLLAVLAGTLGIARWADAPAPLEGAAAATWRHVIAGCLLVIGCGTPHVLDFGQARGLVLFVCASVLGIVFAIWRRSPARWLAVAGGIALLLREAAS